MQSFKKFTAAQRHGKTIEIAKGLTRRSLIKKVAAFSAAGASAYLIPSARAQSETIAVTCWGGAYEEAVRKAYAAPFAKQTGIRVNLVNNADLAKIKVQVESKNVQWDVFDGVGPQIMAGARQGFWEKIDRAVVKANDQFQGTRDDCIGSVFFAGGLAFDPKRFPEGKRPETFSEFWDAKKFPGRRGLRARISETLEMALLADGVAPKSLYPLDIERGFKALDRIKPDVRKWIETTPETVTLITRNELDFTYTYLSRVLPAQRAGSSVELSMKQTLNSLEYYAVPKHSKNTRAAMQYIAFCLEPKNLAGFCELIEFSPNSKEAMKLASADARKRMPDMNDPNSVVINDDWWGDHYDALQKRFTEWMLT